LAINALVGWWWLDPLVGLGVATVAIKEGIDAWRGEGCECAAIPLPGEPTA
jgi:divalent metal cation (Fe/Co/Zn/Cd) transporter